MYLFNAEVEQIWGVTPDIWRLRISAPKDFCLQAAPGRFIMLGCDNGLFDPLLKRPFGICNWGSDWFEVVIKVVGKGSAQFSQLSKGAGVSVHGPLGEGYPEICSEKTENNDTSLILLAGGMGIASVASCLLPDKIRGRYRKGKKTLLYGAANAAELVLLNEIKNSDPNLQVVTITDDGSSGRKGLVTELLNEELQQQPDAITFACGPEPMLKSVQMALGNHGARGYLSLENRMACGFGVCLGCVQTMADEAGSGVTKNAKVCTQGPVFPAAEVIF